MIPKLTIPFLMALFSIFSFTQLDPFIQDQNVTVGEEYTLILPEDGSFDHVNFPKKNFIIKRGGIADFKKLNGVTVRVKEVKAKGNKVDLERADGERFFNAFPVVTADIQAAIEAGELVRK